MSTMWFVPIKDLLHLLLTCTKISNVHSVIYFVQLFLLDEKIWWKIAQQKSILCKNNDNNNQRFRGNNELGGFLFEIWV